jgi:NADH-quinone oxidoreductase E subunit
MPLEFSAEDRAHIQKLVDRYPHRPAALLPVLHYVQDKLGHLSREAQLLVAQALDVPPARVHEVVTFYEMYHEHPEGQFHLELCTNIACHLVGGDALLEHLKQRLGCEVGHQTEDGMFSLIEVECLASCGSGPMMKVGEDYYEGLSVEAVDALLERFKQEAPGLSGRHYRCAKGGPHVGPVAGFAPKLPVLQGGTAPKAGEGGLPAFEAPRGSGAKK